MNIAMIKALSDGTRLKIVEYLSQRVYCVKALSLFLGLSESAVSQHMKVLRDAGLVEGVKFGYYTHYRLRRDALQELAQAMLAMAAPPPDKECDAEQDIGCHPRKD